MRCSATADGTVLAKPVRPAVRGATHAKGSARHQRLQRWRRTFQAGFFLLFLLAPALNLLRFDLNEAQLWFLGQRWSLGIDAFQRGDIDGTQAALNILWRAIVPGVVLVGTFIAVAWRYGRLYCGWLCPHFSLVETLNGVLQHACGKLSLWDAAPTAAAASRADRRWWPVFGLTCVAAGLLWAVTLLTYLLPPAQIWHGLLTGTLTPNQARFIAVGTILIAAELAFARHLFCRFGCAVGFFQSLAWMANPRALVMAFDRQRAADCRSCGTAAAPDGSACEASCPMRLQPRRIKRQMFSCVQCGQCLAQCENSNASQGRAANLDWTIGVEALRETLRQRRGD